MSDAASDARVDPDVGASASTEDDVETSEAFKVRPPTLPLAPPPRVPPVSRIRLAPTPPSSRDD